MSHHTTATTSGSADGDASTRKIRSIARLFGRGERQRHPVSIETDAKLRAAHVRAARFRSELY